MTDAELDKLVQEHSRTPFSWRKFGRAVEAATLERAAADTRRIDWLSRAGDVSVFMLHDQPGDGLIVCDTDMGQGRGKTLRDAIDAAKSEQEQP